MGGYALTPVERLALLGGFLQGEACVSTCGGTPRLHVTNTYLPILQELRDALGGTIRVCRRAEGNYRTQFEWYVTGPRAANALLSMRRYLGEKVPQVDAVIEWYVAAPNSARRAALEQRLRDLKKVDYGKTDHPD